LRKGSRVRVLPPKKTPKGLGFKKKINTCKIVSTMATAKDHAFSLVSLALPLFASSSISL